jgi:hypothetical protein
VSTSSLSTSSRNSAGTVRRNWRQCEKTNSLGPSGFRTFLRRPRRGPRCREGRLPCPLYGGG